MNLKPEVIYLVKCRVLTAGKSLNIERSGVVERKCYYFAGAAGNIKQSPANRSTGIYRADQRQEESCVLLCDLCLLGASWHCSPVSPLDTIGFVNRSHTPISSSRLYLNTQISPGNIPQWQREASQVWSSGGAGGDL